MHARNILGITTELRDIELANIAALVSTGLRLQNGLGWSFALHDEAGHGHIVEHPMRIRRHMAKAFQICLNSLGQTVSSIVGSSGASGQRAIYCRLLRAEAVHAEQYLRGRLAFRSHASSTIVQNLKGLPSSLPQHPSSLMVHPCHPMKS